MKTDDLKLLGFLNGLRRGGIYYRLSRHHDDAIMEGVSVPGERWEVAILAGRAARNLSGARPGFG